MPGRMMTVTGFNKSGQALSWDFKVLEPGIYEVAVVNLVSNRPRPGVRVYATAAMGCVLAGSSDGAALPANFASIASIKY